MEYRYRARTRKGELVQGEIEAENIIKVRDELQKRGLFIVEITPKGTGLRREITLRDLLRVFSQGNKITPKDLALFARQMSTILEAGITILQGLALVEKESSNPALKSVVGRIRTDVENGASLADAMAKTKAFPPLFLGLVRTGETVGKLDVVLSRLAQFLERDLALLGKIRSSMVYPIFVMIFAVLVSWFLLVFVVPQFANILTSIGGELPLFTRFILFVSTLLKFATPPLVLLGVFGFLVHRCLYLLSAKYRERVDSLKLRLPFFGKIIRMSIMARFSRATALLIRGGVGVLEALSIVRGVVGNAVIEKALDRAYSAVSKGARFTDSLDQKVFPAMLVSMASIGEEGGLLGEMLDKVADHYERETEELVASLASLVEPILIVFLGVVVGSIVIGMFLPLFKIIEVLSAQ